MKQLPTCALVMKSFLPSEPEAGRPFARLEVDAEERVLRCRRAIRVPVYSVAGRCAVKPKRPARTSDQEIETKAQIIRRRVA
jgi:hypothetical protein